MAITHLTKEQKDAFERLEDALPVLLGEEAILFTTDTERFTTMYTPREFSSYTAKAGDILAPGSGGRVCVETGNIVDKIVPKEVYGMAFRTIALPVVENGKTIGCVALARSRDKQQSVSEIADTLSATSEEVLASIQEIASCSDATDKAMQSLTESIKELLQGIQQIYEMNSVIRNIASQTNLLALNAAIEAARAGEAGRGFSVVAEEVKKLAAQSTESIAKVNDILKVIQKSISHVDENVNNTGAMAAQQARTTKEIGGAVEAVATNAIRLNEISKTL